MPCYISIEYFKNKVPLGIKKKEIFKFIQDVFIYLSKRRFLWLCFFMGIVVYGCFLFP